MKSLFAAFRPIAAGQPLNPEVGAAGQPCPRDHEPADELEPTPDRLRLMESTGLAPYPTRLRVMLALALVSWAMVALIAWAIWRF